MNAETLLLRTVGDQQFKYCPPNVRDLRVISADYTKLIVLHRFYPVIVNGWEQSFTVLRVWASNPSECNAMSTVYSLN